MSAPPPPPNQPAAAVGGMKGLDRPIKDVYKAVPGAKPLQSFSPASGKWWPGGLATLTQRGGANDPPVVDTTTVERLMSVLGSLTMNGDYNRGTQAIGGTIDAKIARSTSPLVGTWMESLSRVSFSVEGSKSGSNRNNTRCSTVARAGVAATTDKAATRKIQSRGSAERRMSIVCLLWRRVAPGGYPARIDRRRGDSSIVSSWRRSSGSGGSDMTAR